MMLKLKLLIILFFISLSFYSFAQRGKNGAKTVTAANTVVNEYTTLTADAISGATSITVANSGLNTHNRFSATLSAGDLIMIIQVQGASIMVPASSVDSLYGKIANYNNCGLYEFAEVLSVPNSTTINIECPLSNNYTETGKTEIVRVPRYTSLTINSPGVLTGDTWNGAQGGICVVEVLGNTTVNSGGTMDMSGKGFRGGVLHNDNPAAFGVNNYYNSNITYGAEKGEGIAGFETDYDALGGRYCRGAPANGGGGANANSHGGGGGANAGDTGLWTGLGNPDITTSATYVQAWNLELTYANATSSSSGGGRGGYSYSGAGNQDPLTLGPWNTNGNSQLWGGDWRRFCAGQGGRPLDYSTGRIYLGGGGGAGDEDHTFGSAGANGGGIIFIQSYGNISGSGQITSNGATAANSTSGNGVTTSNADGAGGGGAGGTIIIKCTGTATGISAAVNGGNGGNQVKNAYYNTSNHEAEGPGGGGGGGYIAISNGAITTTANGGANGITNSSGITQTGKSFPPNGATKGGAGITNAIIPPQFIVAANNDTICPGDSVSLLATIIGTAPPGITIIWYDSIVGGNIIATGNTYNTPKLDTTTSYYIGTCPGTFHQQVTVVVQSVVANAGSNVSICNGNNTTLHATGGGTYAWSPSSGLSSTNIANPVASPTSTTEYYLTVSNSSGCKSVDSVKVTVNNGFTFSAGSNASICPGTSTSLHASGAATYAWSPAASLSSSTVADPIASPTSTTSYIVLATNGSGCIAADTVVVTVFPKVNANAGADTSICTAASAQLHATGGTVYLWSPSSTLSSTTIADPVASPTTNTTYFVTVTDANSCSAKDSVTVDVSPNLVITVSPNSPTICSSGGSVQLIASGGINYSWSPSSGLSATTGSIVVANPTVNTIYSVSATNVSGCSGSATVTVTIATTPFVLVTPRKVNLCEGDSVQFTASGATTYAWSPGFGLSSTSGITVIAKPTASTTYIVTGTTSGCSAIDSGVVTVYPLPIAQITSHTDATCGLNNGSATASGGTSYNWSNGQSTATVTGLSQGIYTVTVSNSFACTSTALITINQTAPVTLAILAIDSAACGDANGDVYVNIITGTPSYTYLWSDGQNTLNLLNVVAGVYTLTVTDINNCSNTVSATVSTAIPFTSIVAAADSILKCYGDDNGYITFSVTGGTLPFSYAWSNGDTTKSVSNLSAGLYTVTITDKNGCQNIHVVPVTQPSKLFVNITSSDARCRDSCNGTVTSSVTGGTPFSTGNYDYLWSNGQTSEGINGLCHGTYDLTVTDANGCQDSLSINIGIRTYVKAGFTYESATPPYSPLPVSFTYTGSISFSNLYNWSFGDGTPSGDSINPKHIYYSLVADSFKVCLTVIDSTCREDTCEKLYVDVHSKLKPPNVFMPGDPDINNSTFIVSQDTSDVRSIATFNCEIFDRWGKKVYEWSDINTGWDGGNCAEGTYYYIITAKGYDNETYNLHGAVMLLRTK